ncbi:hypothetical protein HD554DRAFT_2039603 [Boletus coccyginus]|nr:hypothetical protein HD554DRAFT_2039603 [Boletus coccyginus]
MDNEILRTWYESRTQIFTDLMAEEVLLSVVPQTYLWDEIKYLGLPLLAELKASGAHGHNVHRSLFNGAILMSLAYECIPHQDFEIADHLTAIDEEEKEDVQPEKDKNPILPDQDGIHTGLVEVLFALDEKFIESFQQQLYSFNLSALPSQGMAEEDAKFHIVLPADQMEL